MGGGGGGRRRKRSRKKEIERGREKGIDGRRVVWRDEAKEVNNMGWGARN